MLENILAYPTFRRLVKSLKGQTKAGDFLRLRFLGNLDQFERARGEEQLAGFLAALGVLTMDQNLKCHHRW